MNAFLERLRREPTLMLASRSSRTADVAIDHMGYLTEPDPAVERGLLARLGLGSCWIRLSGAYRVAKSKPLSSAAPLGRALVSARPDRLIWGSDWPRLPDGSPTPAGS